MDSEIVITPSPYLSRKFIIEIAILIMGFVALMTGKCTYTEFAALIGLITSVYFGANAYEAKYWQAS